MRPALLFLLLIHLIVVAGYLLVELRSSTASKPFPWTAESLQQTQDRALSVFAPLEKAPEAVLALIRSAESGDGKDRELTLCSAALTTIKAIQRNREDPRLHLLFAIIWQEVQESTCLREFDSSLVEKGVRFALESAPYHPRYNLLAARWYAHQKKQEEMLSALRRFVAHSTDASADEDVFVLEHLSSPLLFHRIVPSKFPQLITWWKRLQTNGLVDSKAWQDTIDEKFSVALTALETDFKRGSIPADIAEHFLQSSYSSSLNPATWQKIDRLYAAVAESSGAKTLADYLRHRSELLRVPIVAGLREHDLRPEAGELAQWGSIQRVKLGNESLSVGFYVPRGWQIDFIELHPDSAGMDLSAGGTRVFVSENNDEWIAIDEQVKLERVLFQDRNFIVLRHESEYFPYIKILAQTGRKDRGVANRLSSLFRVFGRRG